MTADPVSAFRAALADAGLCPPDHVEADGALHRCPSSTRRGDDAGWYVLHGDGIPAGAYGDWRTGVSETWRADIGRPLTPAEESQHRARVEAMRREREAERERRQSDARDRAREIWASATPAPEDHPYLAARGIRPHGARLHGDALVIPMRAGGELHSLQFVAPDGAKRFLSGGRVSGCYASIGTAQGADALCIAEGYATGASIHEATGYPVAVAFTAGNLLPVARALRERYPDMPIILCADDDYRTAGNPGLTQATEAARAVGGLVAVPEFGHDRPDGATDFNDMARLRGTDSVGQTVAAVLDALLAGGDSGGSASPRDISEGTEGTQGTALIGKGKSGSLGPGTSGNRGNRPGEPLPKPDVERGTFAVHDEWTGYGRPGLYWHGGTDDDPEDQWVCSPLHADALAHGEADSDYGLLLRFRNAAGRWREWTMPMRMLKGSGEELRGELLDLGVRIDPRSHRLLNAYLMNRHPDRRILAATRTGWHLDGKVFVMPIRVIGAGDVRYQSEHAHHDAYATAGTLAGWQSEIAARCSGNPVLVLAVSAALAGPLLAPTHRQGGGLHFVGDSSTGKSTALAVAASCWGGDGFIRTWRATANGLEGIAAGLNDTALLLDEISEADPRDLGTIVYALGNGTGKSRAARTGGARAVQRWRVMLLSSGERTLAATMAEGGKRTKAGQEARLLDIPCARAHGVFDTLHGLPDGRALADCLKTAASRHYGHAGPEMVGRLIADPRDYGELLARFVALPEFAAKTSLDGRAAHVFALAAMAGELASEWDLVPWPEGAALEAATLGYRLWREHRGEGHTETRQILRAVGDFLARFGDSRFSATTDPEHGTRSTDRAGWWRDTESGRVYLFTGAGLREATEGHDFRRALEALDEAGWIAERDEGRRSKKTKIGGRAVNLYAVMPADEGDA